MLRALIVVLTLLVVPTALLADDKPAPPATKTPTAEPLTLVSSGWVRPDGKVAATMIRAVPETRTGVRSAVKLIDGMQVVVREEVPYTIMRSIPCTIQADTTEVLDIQGKPVSGTALAAQLAKPGPVLVTRGPLDPEFRKILKDDALVLVSSGGVSVQGVPEGPRWLPSVTLASVLERDGEVRLRLVESEALRASEKRIMLVDGQEVERTVEKTVTRNVTRELTFDGLEVQACDLKGERLGTRALLKRLKEWAPVLVLKQKPDTAYAQTFKDDTVVLLLGGGEPTGLPTPDVRPPARTSTPRLDRAGRGR